MPRLATGIHQSPRRSRGRIGAQVGEDQHAVAIRVKNAPLHGFDMQSDLQGKTRNASIKPVDRCVLKGRSGALCAGRAAAPRWITDESALKADRIRRVIDKDATITAHASV